MSERDVLGEDVRAGFNLLRLIRDGWAMSLEVFLHHRFGPKYLGIQTLFGLFAMLGVILCNPQADGRPMVFVIAAYLFLLVSHRLETARAERRGEYIHSYYTGKPWLWSVWGFRRMDESKLKGRESVFCALVGVFIFAANLPLGVYMLFGGLCLASKLDGVQKREQDELRRVRDAFFERRTIAERIRDDQRRWS